MVGSADRSPPDFAADSPDGPAGVGLRDRIVGCLLAGAVGDALGAPVEFMELAEIRERFGPTGVTDLVDGAWPAGTVTDDTQMTLWTAEGLIRANERFRSDEPTHVVSIVDQAYLRWLHTQGAAQFETGFEASLVLSGWLITEPVLAARRAPGATCLAGLADERTGTVADPLNHSKGCGAVMRSAPVGLVVDEPFSLACDLGALTHGHPSGYLSAGALASMIARLVAGDSLLDAVAAGRRAVAEKPEGGEVIAALDAAVALATDAVVQHRSPTPEELEALGGGWVGEEALAIAVACALSVNPAGPGPLDVLLASVNHSGDSDSTGSICGNLLGAHLGSGWLDRQWVARLDVGPVLGAVAHDLYESFAGSGSVSPDRYPPY